MISVRLNDMGLMSLRGRASVRSDLIRMSLPEDTVESVEIKLAPWLGSATVASRTIEAHGLTITDYGVTSNVWNFQTSGVGYANLKVTASDGRAF